MPHSAGGSAVLVRLEAIGGEAWALQRVRGGAGVLWRNRRAHSPQQRDPGVDAGGQ